MNDYPRELEVNEADELTREGMIVPMWVGNENTYYMNAAGKEYYCKNYPHAEMWPVEYYS